ncbi:extracellular solute-binding protein [Metabacillus idriensis]|uniref:extracellular solute-binding protein n=1 Tax=Metabacillus idriensis TaxID=324768 RepID=UPI00174EA4AE|nr:extracellular solute-binding protein [Metabacillus idriensis]
MKKKMSAMISFALICTLVFALAGCSSKSSSGSENAGKEIVFWNPFTGPDGKNMQKIIDDYNKTNPDYKVKNVSLKEQDMYTKIPTVVNSGKNIPDVTIVHAERIKQFVANDMLTPLDDSLTNYPDIKAENYVKAGWDIGDLDGKRYSVPLDVHSFVMYYNKKLVDKYAPNALDDNVVTFDEIKQAGDLAKKDDIKAMGLTWMRPIFLSIYNQMGGDITSDGEAPTLDTKEAADTLKLLKSLVNDKYTNKDGQDPGQLFKSGKAIFYPEGIWMQNGLNEVKSLEWGLTNFPQLSEDKIVNWSSSHQFVMFNSKERNESKSEGVIKFLDYIRQNSLPWAEAGQNPAALATLEDEKFQNLPQSFLVKDQKQQETLKIFDYQYNGFVADEIDKFAGDAAFGKVKIEDALKKSQKAVEDKISQSQKKK